MVCKYNAVADLRFISLPMDKCLSAFAIVFVKNPGALVLNLQKFLKICVDSSIGHR